MQPRACHSGYLIWFGLGLGMIMRCCSQFIAPLPPSTPPWLNHAMCCVVRCFQAQVQGHVCLDALKMMMLLMMHPPHHRADLSRLCKAGQPVFEAEEQNRNQIRGALELRNEVDVLCGCADLCSSA